MTSPARLSRTLQTSDAVSIGLGAMIGAGIFSAIGPAVRDIGNALLLALLIAATLAYLNASSVSRLAALYPLSGGVYVYGNRRLGPFWGFLAGWGFIIGKLASCAAMAMTFAHHAAPDHARPLAVLATLALTGINCLGVHKTVFVTRLLLSLVIAALGLVIFSGLAGGSADLSRIYPLQKFSLGALLQASGILFFAFAGYARIATLGEEVLQPERTIPRAIHIALGVTFLLYIAVFGTALLTVDPRILAHSHTPLTLVVESGKWSAFAPVVRLGAALASLGVLLSLIAGIGRTSFAMANQGDLPGILGNVHPRYGVPHHAEIAAGLIIAVAAATVDLRGAIGFSSFGVLIYYSIGHASAFTLPGKGYTPKRLVPVLGGLGCVAVAFSLPATSVLGGILTFAIGTAIYIFRHRLSRNSAAGS